MTGRRNGSGGSAFVFETFEDFALRGRGRETNKNFIPSLMMRVLLPLSGSRERKGRTGGNYCDVFGKKERRKKLGSKEFLTSFRLKGG